MARAVWRWWTRVARRIGDVQARILLSIFYYVILGPFALVRNPVYTTMVGISLGAFLLVPTSPGALGIAVCIAGVELQTRRVEEPHLRALRTHKDEAIRSRAMKLLPE